MKKSVYIIKGVVLAAMAFRLFPAFGAEVHKPYAPRIGALLKTRFETDTQTGAMRFAVNNARLGIGGYDSTAHGTFRYYFQAELNAEGKFSILDTYAAYTTGAFEVIAGQQQYLFGTELNRGPRFNYFADPSLLGRFVGSYYDISGEADGSWGNLGSRDIGVVMKYRNPSRIPINLLAGAVNGCGINTSVWRKNINFVARVWIDENTLLGGFGAAANIYIGRTPSSDRIAMWGGELRYRNDTWIIEGEYARRRLKHKKATDNLDLVAVHAVCLQPVKGWGIIKLLAPMARWDYGHNIPVKDSNSHPIKLTVHRATAGLTIGFAGSLRKCEIRLNYEYYFIRNMPPALAAAASLHNKFIAEFFLAF